MPDQVFKEGVPSKVDTTAHNETWGISAGYWLCPVTIKILFVIDGRINLASSQYDFGLGYVLDTLLAPFSYWVRFEIDIGKRDGDLDQYGLGSYQLTYQNFKFTQSGFDINNYDQVWLFGDLPYLDSATDADIPTWQLDNDELKILGEWMDRGGGVFAAGDHSILGASLCSKIPRVRTMRKWRQDQGVPKKFGPSRNQTLQPTSDIQDHQEGDLVLQPIEPVYRRVSMGLPLLQQLVPHPLLCSTQGVITHFPDHMHEGEVIPDQDVKLDQPLNIPGYHRPEYPYVVPGVVTGGSAEVDLLPRFRPRPHVIAYGRTTNTDPFGDLPIQLGASPRLANPSFLPTRQFGLISVYDGDSVNIGRVVVESTWHHWFSLNLTSIAQSDTPTYRMMQSYYRNVGIWLAKRAQRSSMLVASTWAVLNGAAPMAFGTDSGPWEIGERVLNIVGVSASPCILGELVGSVLDQNLQQSISAYAPTLRGKPSWATLPEELTNRALVGGIGAALLDLSLEQQEKRAQGQRPQVDFDELRQRAMDGVMRGHKLLSETVQEAARSFEALSNKVIGIGKPR
jgi:hypothetical protein